MGNVSSVIICGGIRLVDIESKYIHLAISNDHW
jgi:hypothetical protein